MAQVSNTFWNRYKYKLNGLILILPLIFLYQSLTPEFPPTWEPKEVGSFSVTPMPYNLDAPYLHHDTYTKDFFLIFTKGDIDNIRQAYFNLGKAPIELTKLQLGDEGILHGSKHGQEVHAISPPKLTADDKAWLTIEDWQGKVIIASWDLPESLLP